jgi:type I restriction enzyme S subunit
MTEMRLGDVAAVKHGFPFDGRYFVDEPRTDVLVTPGNFAVGGGFKEEKLKYYDGPVTEAYVLPEGEVIITMTDLSKTGDTLGYAAFVPKRKSLRFLHNQRIGRLMITRPDLVDKNFLCWLLRTPTYRDEVLAGATGTTVKHTSPKRIEAFRFAAPNVLAQRAIARTLQALDDKIELNRRTNETLEGMARALFKSWFVDFDPVHAKKQGRKPHGMDAASADLFPASFERSSSGAIPSGWSLSSLGKAIEVLDSQRIPLSSRERQKRPGIYPYYGATSVMDHVDAFLFDGPHLLVGEDGSVVREDGTPFLQYVWGKFWVNNHAHVLRGTGGISTEHLLLFLKQCNIAAFVTGAVQAKLNQGNLCSIPLVLPPSSISGAFGRLVEPTFARLRTGTEQTANLAAVRDALLPKLLSGEVRVPEAERIVGKAV